MLKIYSGVHTPLCLQACRSEAEHVLQNASCAGLGGGLQLQTYHNLQVLAFLANLTLIDNHGGSFPWLITLILGRNVTSCAMWKALLTVRMVAGSG